MKCLGLASVTRIITRQHSRLMFLREGNTNTKFFHLQVCHHGHKNQIFQLSHHGMGLRYEEDKANAIFEFFDQLLVTQVARVHDIDFATLGMPWIDHTLDHCFSEEEVWGVIKQMALDKASVPDGFTDRFYQSAWPVIKRDVVQVFSALWLLDARSLFLLNHAYIVLLRKSPDAEEIKDFCPISLIHSFGKLFTKVLSAHLAPYMASLVLPNQSAFIRG
jgi:hypothetical protein